MPTRAELTEEQCKVKTKLNELQEKIATEERQYTVDENAIIEALFIDYDSIKNQIRMLDLEPDADNKRQIYSRNYELHHTPETQLSESDKQKLIYRQAFYDFMLNGDKMHAESQVVLTRGLSKAMMDRPGLEAHYRGKRSYAQRANEIWTKFRSQLADHIHWGNRNPETRDQALVPVTAGGYLVPEGFSNEITEQMLFYGGMREAARIYPTATGNDIPWPTLDDTANKAVIVAENAPIPSNADLVFGQVILRNYKYATQVIKVSWELLQDSFFDFESLIAQAYGMRMARGTNEHFTIGTGTGEPLGVVRTVNVPFTLPAGSTQDAPGFSMDLLKDLIYSVDRMYRPMSRFMIGDITEQEIYKLSVAEGTVNVDNRALWQPSFTEGVPDRILGYEYTVNADMPVDYAAGADKLPVVLFGDFNYYIIRDIAPMTMRRLDELYAVNGQVGFLGWARYDGRPVYAVTNVTGSTPIKGIGVPTV